MLAKLETRDSGKPIRESREDMAGTADMGTGAAGQTDDHEDEAPGAPSDKE